jgi:atlastin
MDDGNKPLSGFSWKHGFDPDTKGILFWPDVFLHDSPTEKIAIIVMDTQGLFEIGSTQDENARIFGLSTLISSIQIVNSRGEIQENQIEYLEMATSFTKFVNQMKKSQWKPFQKLRFLIRDWAHEGILGGFGYGGGETYLDKFLSASGRPGTAAQSIRQNIYESFDDIKCFLLGHPGNAVNKENFKGEWGRLDEDFVKNLKNLVESLLAPQNLNKKSIFGKEVTGSEFRGYINAYFEAFKNAKVPETSNIYETMANNQLKSIADEQFNNYKKSLKENLDFEQENFEIYINNKNEASKNEALENFHKTEKIEDQERISTFLHDLEEKIIKHFIKWREATMIEYQRFTEIKKKIDELNKEKAESKQVIDNLQKEVQTQAKVQEKLTQEQKREADQFKAQINSLNSQNENVKRLMQTQSSQYQQDLMNERKKQEENINKLQSGVQEASRRAQADKEQIRHHYESQMHQIHANNETMKHEMIRRITEVQQSSSQANNELMRQNEMLKNQLESQKVKENEINEKLRKIEFEATVRDFEERNSRLNEKLEKGKKHEDPNIGKNLVNGVENVVDFAGELVKAPVKIPLQIIKKLF